VKRLLMTGGTGMIGSELVPFLQSRGYLLTLLTRNRDRVQRLFGGPIHWLDDLNELTDTDEFDGVINLAGESLADGRWTHDKKRRLFSSRLDTTRALLAWVRRARRKPAYLISGSAVGFYGPRGDTALDESDPGADSFGHRLCVEWEAVASLFAAEGVDVTRLRLGVVFARTGGAFEQLRRSFDWKLATVMGDGSHYCSWIHVMDLLRVLEFLLTQSPAQRLSGAVNATAPTPIRYGELSEQLARAKNARIKLPLPPALLRLVLGEMADELLLQGQRVLPVRLQQSGFQFQFPSLDKALPDLLT